MSFIGNSGNSGMEIMKSPMECKPDYEAQAAIIKKKHNEINEFKKAFESFIEKNDLYIYKNINSLIEFFGAIVYQTKQQENRYNNALERLEKNK